MDLVVAVVEVVHLEDEEEGGAPAHPGLEDHPGLGGELHGDGVPALGHWLVTLVPRLHPD